MFKCSISQQILDADCCTAAVAVPEPVPDFRTLTSSDGDYESIKDLCPLLALPGEVLLQQLLGETPGYPDAPWIWAQFPPLSA